VSELRLRDDGIAWREIDGEMVAIDLVTNTYLSANESGLLLWRALAAGASREDLAALLAERFGIDGKSAAVDVDRFLEELTSRELLRP
jgi:hypothetical protein